MNKKNTLADYLVETNSDDNDSYDDENDNDDVFDKDKAAAGTGASSKENTSKLIDLELVRLIKFCNDLQNNNKHKDEY